MKQVIVIGDSHQARQRLKERKLCFIHRWRETVNKMLSNLKMFSPSFFLRGCFCKYWTICFEREVLCISHHIISYIVNNKSQNPLSVLLPWNHQRSLSLFIFLKFQFYEKWQMILFFKGKCVKYQGQMCHISRANVSKLSRANVQRASDTQSLYPLILTQSIPQVGMGSYMHLQIAKKTVKAAAFSL